MSAMASQITGVAIVCSTVCSSQRKHQSSASLAFVRGIHRWPVASSHKGPVTRKMFPFDDVIVSPALDFFFFHHRGDLFEYFPVRLMLCANQCIITVRSVDLINSLWPGGPYDVLRIEAVTECSEPTLTCYPFHLHILKSVHLQRTCLW